MIYYEDSLSNADGFVTARSSMPFVLPYRPLELTILAQADSWLIVSLTTFVYNNFVPSDQCDMPVERPDLTCTQRLGGRLA